MLAIAPRIATRALEDCPFNNSFGVIESQKARRYLALPRKRFDNSSADTKVIRPLLQTRVKQSDGFPCF